MTKLSEGERLFNHYWRVLAPDRPAPVNGHRFHPTRNWEFDCAWPDVKLAVEIEGGNFSGGRHTRGIGYQNDCEKYNAALSLGWRVYRYTPAMLRDDPSTCVLQVMSALDETSPSLREALVR